MALSSYFDNWYWSTNATKFKCPGTGFACQAPHACARDPNINKRYCCNAAADPYEVCWTGSTACSTDGTTFECASGSSKWCCISKREVCTPAVDQINICWSTGFDTLRNVSVPALESAHSSLSAALPTSASSVPFDPLSLIALTAPAPSSSTTTPSRDSSTTPTPTSASESNRATPGSQVGSGSGSASGSGSSSDTLTTGAIAGIAIGAAAILGLAAIVIFLLRLRSKKSAAASAPDSGGLLPDAQKHHQHHQPQQAYYPDGTPVGAHSWSEVPGSAVPQQPYYGEAYGKDASCYARPELVGHTPAVEMPPGHMGSPPSELPAYYAPQPR